MPLQVPLSGPQVRSLRRPQALRRVAPDRSRWAGPRAARAVDPHRHRRRHRSSLRRTAWQLAPPSLPVNCCLALHCTWRLCLHRNLILAGMSEAGPGAAAPSGEDSGGGALAPAAQERLQLAADVVDAAYAGLRPFYSNLLDDMGATDSFLICGHSLLLELLAGERLDWSHGGQFLQLRAALERFIAGINAEHPCSRLKVLVNLRGGGACCRRCAQRQHRDAQCLQELSPQGACRAAPASVSSLLVPPHLCRHLVHQRLGGLQEGGGRGQGGAAGGRHRTYRLQTGFQQRSSSSSSRGSSRGSATTTISGSSRSTTTTTTTTTSGSSGSATTSGGGASPPRTPRCLRGRPCAAPRC